MKSRNVFAKIALSILGFAMATGQCLAQYMAITPRPMIFGKILGVADSTKRFRIVINNKDTVYSSYAKGLKQYVFRSYRYDYKKVNKVEISEVNDPEKVSYRTVEKIVGLKSKSNDNDNYVEVTLKKK